jgi:hypothetical protein
MEEKIILISEEVHQPQVEPIVNEDVDVVVDDVGVDVTTVVDEVDVEQVSDVEIDISESIGWVGGDAKLHYSLAGRGDPDQHTIGAITGLERRLAVLDALKTVYSDSIGVANYYKWNSGESAEHGYFVSVVPKTATIKVCDGTNIFGVTVSHAGFVGGQDGTTLDHINGVVTTPGVPRGDDYGLVVTSGLVDVRCELDVEVGDYVVSNWRGYAEKTTSRSGYKVLAKEVKAGVEYVVILLGVQADITDTLDKALQLLDIRMDNAEIDIAAAMNMANEAYKMAAECIAANKRAEDKVTNIELDFEDIKHQFGDVSLISSQAKAIADNALLYAESARLQAVTAASQALRETAQFRDELNERATNMDIALENADLELQAAKESILSTKNELQDGINDAVGELRSLEKDLEPLATWPYGVGMDRAESFAGFVARADEDGAILGAMVGRKGEEGETVAGFIQKATDTHALVSGVAEYQQKDVDGNPVGEPSVAGFIAQVDANTAQIQSVAGKGGSIAGLQAKADGNSASITTLASQTIGDYITVDTWDLIDKDPTKIYYAKDTKDYYYFKDVMWHATKDITEAGLDGAIAGVKSTADENKAQLDAMVAYDKDGKSALAGLTAYVDENSAKFSELAKYNNAASGKSGIAGLVADVDSNTSTLSLVAEHSFTDDNNVTHTGLAGLQAQVNDNTSEVALVANRVSGRYVVIDAWDVVDKDVNIIYYAKDTKLYWYYDSIWKSTDDAYIAGLPYAIAGIQVETDDHSAKLNSLASWQGETNVAMASIKQTADANGASIRLFVADIDKYSVGPYSQAYGFTLEQAQDVLEEGMIYVPTPHGNYQTHKEVYNYTVVDQNGKEVTLPYPNADGYQFTTGNLYTWTDIDVSPTTTNMMWKESVGKVSLFPTAPAITAYEFWYKDGGDNSDGYEPYTLYKRDIYTDANGDALTRWIAVATLRGNYSNRATSSIRQDANSIALDVTNVKGNVATIQQTVNENSADIALVVSDSGINAASIVASVNNSGSNVAINADKITMTGTATFLKPGDLGLSSTVIDGNSIVTGKISANNITVDAAKVTGKLSFGSNGAYYIDVNGTSSSYISLPGFAVTDSAAWFSGTLLAPSGSIGGFTINNALISGAKTAYNDGNAGVYISADGIGCGPYFSVSKDGHIVISSQYGNTLDIANGFFFAGRWGFSSGGITFTEYGTSANLFSLDQDSLYARYSSSSRVSLNWTLGDYVVAFGATSTVGDSAQIWFWPDYAFLSGTWESESAIAVTSDKNKKNTIVDITDAYTAIFDRLRPRLYRYNDGTSNRLHVGFIAQEVEEAIIEAGLTTQDFAAFVRSEIYNEELGEMETVCLLRYEEFIALNTREIQHLKARVVELENKLKEV